MSEKEKKDKKVGMFVSGGIHAVILALFILLVAWREPNPPLPEYGIELNLGFDDTGSGDTRSTEPVEVEQPQDDPPSAEEEAEEIEQEVVEEEPAEEVTEPEEEVVEEPPVQKEATEDPVEEVEEVVETQTEKSDVKVEEKKEEATEEKEEETPPKEEKKEEVKPKPKPTVDNRALMGGKKNDSTSNSSSKSEGNSTDKGNEGDPDGDVDQRGLMSGGGDGGPVLDLTGWTWNTKPDPEDSSNETGKIVFKITIDDRGQVMRVVLLESTVSSALVRIYQKEVERVSFKPLSSNSRPAPTSEGKITFVIKTN